MSGGKSGFCKHGLLCLAPGGLSSQEAAGPCSPLRLNLAFRVKSLEAAPAFSHHLKQSLTSAHSPSLRAPEGSGSPDCTASWQREAKWVWGPSWGPGEDRASQVFSCKPCWHGQVGRSCAGTSCEAGETKVLWAGGRGPGPQTPHGRALPLPGLRVRPGSAVQLRTECL